MNPCLSTAIPAGHTHSHFSQSLSVLMCFIGVTNNVTFAFPMQLQLNDRWWEMVHRRKTGFTVSGSIFLWVWSFCSQHLKYMQIFLYMQIYADDIRYAKNLVFLFIVHPISFFHLSCSIQMLANHLELCKATCFTFKSCGAQTYIVTV